MCLDRIAGKRREKIKTMNSAWLYVIKVNFDMKNKQSTVFGVANDSMTNKLVTTLSSAITEELNKALINWEGFSDFRCHIQLVKFI